MSPTLLSVASVLFGLVLSSTVPSSSNYVPLTEWSAESADRFIADTQLNWGYLVRETGEFTSFPIVTGQKRTVRYIGRVYNAATPARFWIAKSLHIKGDRTTFGPTGEFLRLYEDGQEETAYGIHSHRSAAKMLAEEDRFRSMGCIIVSDEVMALLIETFRLNGESLEVATSYGIALDSIAQL